MARCLSRLERRSTELLRPFGFPPLCPDGTKEELLKFF